MSVKAPFRVQVRVAGMTCQHCVMSVTEEVGELDGVRAVEADLASGAVTVLSERELDPQEIAAAVGGAGYRLVD